MIFCTPSLHKTSFYVFLHIVMQMRNALWTLHLRPSIFMLFLSNHRTNSKQIRWNYSVWSRGPVLLLLSENILSSHGHNYHRFYRSTVHELDFYLRRPSLPSYFFMMKLLCAAIKTEGRRQFSAGLFINTCNKHRPLAGAAFILIF